MDPIAFKYLYAAGAIVVAAVWFVLGYRFGRARRRPRKPWYRLRMIDATVPEPLMLRAISQLENQCGYGSQMDCARTAYLLKQCLEARPHG